MIKLTKRISLIFAFFIISIVTVACGVLFLFGFESISWTHFSRIFCENVIGEYVIISFNPQAKTA
ncbi:hypothetical protein [Vagococcus silagei]